MERSAAFDICEEMKKVILFLALAVHGTSASVEELSPILATPAVEKCKFCLQFFFEISFWIRWFCSRQLRRRLHRPLRLLFLVKLSR